MPILDRNKREDVQRYNAFVQNAPFTSATQDLEWSGVKEGWESVQFYIEQNNKIVAAASVLTRNVFKYKMLYAPKGPVCDIYDTALVEALMREIDRYAKANHAFMFRMDPERNYDVNLEALYKARNFKVRNRHADKDELIQPRYNMVLGIAEEDEESLLASFSSKTRYNINLAARKGIKVHWENSEEALDHFYELSEIMSKRQKIFNRSKAYYQKILEAFGDNARIYIAKHEDHVLAAAIGIHYGDKVWYIYGASSNEKRNLMPNYLMQWEMIRWALGVSASYYDFGGVFELNKEDGLYRFKEGFCRKDGVTELIGEIDRVYKPLIYHGVTEIYPKVKKLRSRLKKRT